MHDRSVVAVEALARWRHPLIGQIDPARFIATAEQCGLVEVIDDFVLDRACADAQALDDTFGAELDLHVNVSAGRFGQPSFETRVASALRRHGRSPNRLVLEITETSRILDLRAATACAHRIRGSGVRVALDGFGSGFSCLEYLLSLPLDVIKLDAALTSADADLSQADVLCHSVLTLCRQMHLKLVPEGIENEREAVGLRRMGCQFGQGYLFGRPMALDSMCAVERRAKDCETG